MSEQRHSAEKDAGVQRVAYVHAAVCSWITNNAWCDCGLDEAVARAIKDEAVANADRLYAMSEAADQVARDLLDFNPGHGDFLNAGKSLRAALDIAEASMHGPHVVCEHAPPCRRGADGWPACAHVTPPADGGQS